MAYGSTVNTTPSSISGLLSVVVAHPPPEPPPPPEVSVPHVQLPAPSVIGFCVAELHTPSPDGTNRVV